MRKDSRVPDRFKQVSVAENIKGTVDLPLNANTIALLTYNRIGDTIYMHSNTVLGDVQFPTPQRISDFSITYYDNSVCAMTWTAPYANNIYDSATEYDIRYANSRWMLMTRRYGMACVKSILRLFPPLPANSSV